MEREEKLRRLTDRLGVTAEEAAGALDAVGGDLLDAALWLERTKSATQRVVHTHSTAAPTPQPGATGEEAGPKTPTGDQAGEIFSALLSGLVTHPILNGVSLERKGQSVTTIPGAILVALFLVRFWVVPALFAVWLLLGLHCRWVGPQWDNSHLNNAWAALEDKAAGLRESMKGGQHHG